jgi:uncharacterized protein (DUF433 family)
VCAGHPDRIQVVPGVCEGRPTIRGLRITVESVLKLLADGYVADDIAREYPELEKEDVYQAARFGAWLTQDSARPTLPEAPGGPAHLPPRR